MFFSGIPHSSIFVAPSQIAKYPNIWLIYLEASSSSPPAASSSSAAAWAAVSPARPNNFWEELLNILCLAAPNFLHQPFHYHKIIKWNKKIIWCKISSSLMTLSKFIPSFFLLSDMAGIWLNPKWRYIWEHNMAIASYLMHYHIVGCHNHHHHHCNA